MFASAALIGGGIMLGSTNAQAGTAGETPQFKTCAELDKEFNSQVEYSRVYDPTGKVLTISAEKGTYLIDLENKDCLNNYPKAKALVDEVLAEAKENNLSECRGTLEQLKRLDPEVLKDPKATFETPKGTVYVPALVKYAEELCEPFGIPAP